MNLEELKLYKAKSDERTIYEHNWDLINVLTQIKDIYNINEKLYEKLIKVVNYHDIGKVIQDFQDDLKAEVIQDDSGAKVRKTKVRHEILSASLNELDDDERIAILTHHKSIEDLIGYVNAESYGGYRNEIEEKLNAKTIDVMKLIKKLIRGWHEETLKDKSTILLKGYLNLCDHLASSGIETIEKGFKAKESFNFKDNLTDIQNCVLENKYEDILINAPTGFGKTSTSLYWSDMIQNKENSRRIFYLLPYTASINALYKDFKERKMSVGMLHGKAKYFLSKLENKDILDIRNEYSQFQRGSKQVTICTIYQILKALYACKNFEMILAMVNNSIFIVDEIHCFSIREFTLIVEMLKYLKCNFNINICIMSASMPLSMTNIIKEKLNIENIIRPLNESLSSIRRHIIKYHDEFIEESFQEIESKLEQGKQVLICVNSVQKSQDIYKHFEKYNPKLIHGKLNSRDRELAEKEIKSAKLLIGTQAIEVSLDIDFDYLYTEVAPLDSLLQRVGRVNRRGKKKVENNIFIFNDSLNSSSIYDKETVILTKDVIRDIEIEDDGFIHESKVEGYLNKVYKTIDYEEYDEVAKGLNFIIEKNKLGTYYDLKEMDMIDSDKTEMISESLLNQYIKYIDKKEYGDARSLMVNCNIKNSYFNTDYHVYVTKYKYIEKIGLTNEIVN